MNHSLMNIVWEIVTMKTIIVLGILIDIILGYPQNNKGMYYIKFSYFWGLRK